MADPFYLDENNILKARILDGIPWVEHGFGTRLSYGWPGERTLRTLHQIHSDIVVVDNGQTGRIGEGDALITDRRGAMLGVRTADCLPILLVDTETRIVSAVHAGWRGTAALIASKAVASMSAQFGSKPQNLIAAIGPGIAQCCFEVGADVAHEFQLLVPERDLSTRTRIDLVEANRRQLRQTGVPEGKIVSAGHCTCCNAEVFHSFRRDREASGRMLSAVGIKG